MKKFSAITLIFLLALTNCGSDGGDDAGSSPTFMLKNESSKTIEDITRNNTSFMDSEESSDFIGTWISNTSAYLEMDATIYVNLEINENTWGAFFAIWDNPPPAPSSSSCYTGGTWKRKGNAIIFLIDGLSGEDIEYGTAALSENMLIFTLNYNRYGHTQFDLFKKANNSPGFFKKQCEE